MMSNKKNILPSRFKHFCLNLLKKALLCIFIVVMALTTIISAVPALLTYLLIGNYNMHSFKKNKCRTSLNHFYE